MALEQEILSCCATTYSHPLARWLPGDSLHPGGLELTSRLAHLAGVGPDSVVLDAGSGLGASAVHLAETAGCRVTGVTLERVGIVAGEELAQRHGVQDRVSFLQGDLHDVEMPAAGFDVVLMECVLSILPRKPRVLDRFSAVLRSGGRIGVTDVTVNGPLPDDLQGALAIAGCVGDALSLEDYGRLIEAQGYAVEHSEELGGVAEATLGGIRDKLDGLGSLAGVPFGDALLTHGKRVLSKAHELVVQGTLSYGLVVARKTQEGNDAR